VPQQVTGVELEELIDSVITETGAMSKRDMGSVMNALGTRTTGNFDKAAAAKIVGARLA